MADSGEDFVAAETFQGARPGFVFKKGGHGLGYYRDRVVKQLQNLHPQGIHAMVATNKIMEVEAMLAKDPSLWHERDVNGDSLLHWAAIVDNLQLVRAGVAAGADVNHQADNLQTPLMWAATIGNVRIAAALLDAGADMHLQDSLGATAAMIAVQHQHGSMLLFFFSREPPAQILAQTDNRGCTLATWAAHRGDLSALKIADYYEFDFCSCVDNEGKTPLFRAVTGQQGEEIMGFLLEKGINPLRRSNDGQTCFDAAVEMNAIRSGKALKKLMDERGMEWKDADQDVEIGEVPQTKKKPPNTDLEKIAHYAPGIFWLACVSLTLFHFLIELWPAREGCPISAVLFELGVVFSLCLFFYVHFSDPGTMTPRPAKLAIEELLRDFRAGVYAKAPKLCGSTWVIKGPRTKYCKITGRVVYEFDHFCGWLNTAIGRGNHRAFMVLTAVEVSTQLFYLYLCKTIGTILVPYKGSVGTWFGAALGSHPLLVLLGGLHSISALYVFALLWYQSDLIFMNYTTNEYINGQRYGYVKLIDGESRFVRSPFCKGGSMANCMDFWWHRKRSEETPSGCCAHSE